MMSAPQRTASLRRLVYELLEHGPTGERRLAVRQPADHAGRRHQPDLDGARDRTWLEARYGRWFMGVELLALVLFTVEYLARVWVAAEHVPDRHLRPRARG